MSDRPNHLIDGELIPFTDEEWDAFEDAAEQNKADLVSKRILAAPILGFGGPTGKDIFNGNR